MIISCVSDNNYLRFLKPLIKSISLNSPSCKVFCWLINCTKEDEQSLKDIYERVEVYHDSCTLSQTRQMLSRDGILLNEYIKQGTETPLLSGGAKWLTSPYMGYCTNVRFKVISEILNRDESTLFLDADAIVRKDVRALDNCTACDLSVRTIHHKSYDGINTPKRPLSDPGNTQYQMGVIFANPSSRMFFECCHKFCFEDCEDWDSNITAFKRAMEIHKPLIAPLPRKYKDEGVNVSNTLHSEYAFDMNSNIWSGPGRRKFVNEQYVNEYLKYT